MTAIFARRACLPTGWAKDVRVTLTGPHIALVQANASVAASDTQVDTLLPALSNLHTHGFQRAMAGMTERRVAGRDSFWTWRTLMYKFLEHLSPDQVQAITALCYLEMLEAGYAAVAEFHYLHHPVQGAYDDIAQMSSRIVSAAEITGIGLTLLPVLYSYGGAGMAPLAGGQLRFGNDVDGFLRLHDAAKGHLSRLASDARIGCAPHSLRASCPADLRAVLGEMPTGPVHIHAAEQPLEVSDVTAWLGARPVAWLLDNMDIDARWCLIHATHMNSDETGRLAKSGAVAGLCPITEGNLGDGPFNGVAYLSAGGAFGIGSDSNIRIALGEELRSLEYSQRLRDLGRNRLAIEPGSVGAALYLTAAKGGAQALGRPSGTIEPGRYADLMAIDRNDPALCTLSDHQILDGVVFAAGPGIVRDVWSAGRHVVQQGRHFAHDQIASAYRASMKTLLATL